MNICHSLLKYDLRMSANRLGYEECHENNISANDLAYYKRLEKAAKQKDLRLFLFPLTEKRRKEDL
jgi:hypothetical protein